MKKTMSVDNVPKTRNVIILASSTILVIVSIIIWAGDFDYMREITKEDGLVENLTALFFLLTCGWCVYCLIAKPRTRYRAFLALWALLSFVFLGEETSWFQRVFDISTPESIQSINEQGELNIHNLRWFAGKNGLVQALKERENILGAVFNSQNIFRMGYFTYFFIFPVLVYSKKFPWIQDKLHYPTPSVFFFTAMWFTILVSLILYAMSSGDRRIILMAETREMTMAALIFVYSITHLDQVTRPPSN